MAAAEGIMNRTPFIDYRLVEEAFTVPAAYKICKPTRESDGTKLIFKDAVKGIIPDEILHRKKTRGFGQPSGKWLRGPLKNLAHNYLFGRESKIVKYLDQKVVNDIFTDHMHGNVASDYYLNSLLIFELWMRTHSAL